MNGFFIKRVINLSTRRTEKINIGRMPASVQPKKIESEFYQQLAVLGPHEMHHKRHQEKRALEDLKKQRDELKQRILKTCVEPSIARYAQGYSITGLYWQMRQKELKQIVLPEDYLAIEEQIDWLETRVKLFNNMGYDPEGLATDCRPL